MDAYIPEFILLYTVLRIIVFAIIIAVVAAFSEIIFKLLTSDIHGMNFQYFCNLWMKLFFFTFPIAFTAYVAGYLSTMSRVTAVGNVLPAVLALIGGLNLYVFGADTKYRVLISYCVCVFALMLFYGSQSGAYLRENSREHRLLQLIAQEQRIRILRQNLGLPEDFPSWIILSEPK